MNRFLQSKPIAGTSLRVPRATVGTMMFGSRADSGESQRIVDCALDHDIGFFDTADSYNDGEAERLLGRALAGRRDRAVVATKVGYAKGADGTEEGISEAAIRRAVDLSLQRLNMDWVDIYYLHRPDRHVPIEESLGTMASLVREGKIRHFGVSNYGAWQTYEILRLCEQNGWPRPVMSQMLYNVLVRQLDFEYRALCRREDLHLTAYNPLAGGLLTGKYTSLHDESKGGRFVGNAMYRKRYWSERMLKGALALRRVADEHGVSLTHLALNWIAQQDLADSILLGPSSAAQLLDCLAAGDSTLTDETLQDIAGVLNDFDGTNATYAR